MSQTFHKHKQVEALIKEFAHEFIYKDGKLYRLVGGFDSGYEKISIRQRRILSHQVVFYLHHGYIPEMIDHINGDGTDNRIENLRAATRSENFRNVPKRKTNTSGAKNVYFLKNQNKWRVSLRMNKKAFYFGIYDDFELAELVAIEAREKYHGKFACHY